MMLALVIGDRVFRLSLDLNRLAPKSDEAKPAEQKDAKPERSVPPPRFPLGF